MCLYLLAYAYTGNLSKFKVVTNKFGFAIFFGNKKTNLGNNLIITLALLVAAAVIIKEGHYSSHQSFVVGLGTKSRINFISPNAPPT